jgi:hypothetical protein
MSKTVENGIYLRKDVFKTVRELLGQEELKRSVRLVGVGLSNLDFGEEEEKEEISQEFQMRLEF